MPKSRIFSDQLSQLCLDVVRDIGIGSLVDCHSGGRVLYEYVADAFCHTRTLDCLRHLVSDVQQLRSTFGPDLNRHPPHVIRVVWEGPIGALRQLSYSKSAHLYGDPQCPRKRQ